MKPFPCIVALSLALMARAAASEFACELEDVPVDRTAKFELWLPPDIGKNERVRGLILVSDYQAGTEIYNDAGFRALAEKLRFGILRHKIFRQKGKRSGPNWDAESVANFLRGLAELAKRSAHPEVADACFIHTGLSWSGMQAPGLAAALPERAIGVVAYHTSDFSEFRGAFRAPLLLLIAEYDQFLPPLDVHEELLKCRAAGALWGSSYQAGAEHQTLGDPELMLAWIEGVVKLRLPAELPDGRPAKLNEIDESSGWLGVLPMDNKTFRRDAAGLPARSVAFAEFSGDRACGRSFNSTSTLTLASSNMKKLKVAVIGAGQFSQCFVPLYKAHPLVDEVSLCEIDPDRLDREARRLGISRTFASYGEVLKARDIDAVAIFTQRWMHAPMALEALAAGKHVYSAVPAATTLEELQQLVEAVQTTGLTYMMGETSLYYGATLFCKEKWDAGEFGRFVYGEGEYYHDMSHGFYEAYQFSGGDQWKSTASYPPMLYPTHSVALVLAVTGARDQRFLSGLPGRT